MITLGGDGTLLFASSLFPKTMPPVLSFHMGSLGFLTPFNAKQFREPLTQLLIGDVPLTIRSRLEYVIIRNEKDDHPLRENSIDYFTGEERQQKIKVHLLIGSFVDSE